MAAELTLFAVLSALPLLLVAAAGLGAVESMAGIKLAGEVEGFIERHITRVLGADTPISDVVARLFADTHGTTLTIGLLAAAYGGSRFIISLVGSLDVIYGKDQSNRRSWVGTRAVGVVLAGVSTVAAAAAIFTIGAGGRIAEATYGDGTVGALAAKAASLFGYSFAALYLSWLYEKAPRNGLSWKRQLPGSIVAVVIGDGAGRLLKWWFTLFKTNAVFGSIGAAMALLWWTYVFASGIILGAEINAWRAEKRSVA